ncbi:T9SS type A sorting domain-containing protein [Dyadobacter sp. MSC1_007]|jgi:hypothetical protein|uniref:T9SS type A sorting domain-containing protein n=1 Tax=Dyadobacter sp. MSC1_007 TaxID=2909264 RepID=UPI00202E6AE1|nr:T9SS type A sorting domain-containing protein [Dyadobacter sp. MSC1_007]
MKTINTIVWMLFTGLSPILAFADACSVTNAIIELNSVSTTGANCTVNVKYSFTLDRNNGNKYAYVHFWLFSDYPDPDYSKAPGAGDLADALTTIAINTNDEPISIMTAYLPDEDVKPQYAGITVTEEDLGGKLYKVTIDNILLLVPNACDDLPFIQGDIWTTQSEAEEPPVSCFLKSGHAIMPVKLTRFGGELLDNAVSLSWTTTEEAGSSYFDIERSGDLHEFNTLGRVQAKGNSTGMTYYHFRDPAPLAGNNYYRLRMVDLDGASENSRIISIDNHTNSVAFQLLGNPVINKEIKFVLKNDDPANIRFSDMMGKSIGFSLNRSGNIFTLTPKGIVPTGLYLLSLQSGKSDVLTKKVLVP